MFSRPDDQVRLHARRRCERRRQQCLTSGEARPPSRHSGDILVTPSIAFGHKCMIKVGHVSRAPGKSPAQPPGPSSRGGGERHYEFSAGTARTLQGGTHWARDAIPLPLESSCVEAARCSAAFCRWNVYGFSSNALRRSVYTFTPALDTGTKMRLFSLSDATECVV